MTIGYSDVQRIFEVAKPSDRFTPQVIGMVVKTVFAAWCLVALGAGPDFERNVAPLLAARCLSCHTGADAKGQLDLSTRDSAFGAGESGERGLVAGDLAASSVWDRIEAGEMPPGKPLPEAERELIRQWIESGAEWRGDRIDPFRFSTEQRAGYDWWSLRPIARPDLPEGSAEHPIDRFVDNRLAGEPLAPLGPADRRTLIRRVTFDLIGLPPTPDEVQAFVANESPTAYQELVDRLLASPHYGERWARHWLDVVRFGETDGFERNSIRPNAWTYRDWVIRALNSDLPYDEFARWQIAGDLLAPTNPDAFKATGALVAGIHNTVLGNEEMRAIARQDELEEIIGVTAQAYLGLTAHCARCHDHKFDPVSQTDFYALAAALGDIQHGERTVHFSEFDGPITQVDADIRSRRDRLIAIEAPARQRGRVAPSRKPSEIEPVAGANPIAAWDFREGVRDLVGGMHLQLAGGAQQTTEGLVLDGKTALARSAPITQSLAAKTLVVWARVEGLAQRGGGLLSIQSLEGQRFDAIVYGEREAQRWVAGSDQFQRTRDVNGPPEKEADSQIVQMAISYAETGRIALYRNGIAYGTAYDSSLQRFEAGQAMALFGCRHEPVGGNRMFAGTLVAARLYDSALSPADIANLHRLGPDWLSEAELVERLSPENRAERGQLKTELAELEARRAELRSRANQTVYAVVSRPAPETRRLERGDVKLPRELVLPAGVRAVAPAFPTDAPPETSPRAKLAQWITSPDQPLFARVIVNRMWAWHFGVGLVDSPSDLGFNGGRPSHPELLDWLAREFMEPTEPEATPYSLKRLHRLIVTSDAYCRASAPNAEWLARDADTRLLWRKRPRRLDAEALRDSLLAVSGLLNRDVGGKGFSDYQDQFLNGTTYFEPIDSPAPEFQRRSIYRFLPRGANPGLLDLFDCPDPAGATPRRGTTTTPLQALSLWNGSMTLRAASALSDRIDGELRAVPEAERSERSVRRAIELVWQREPTAEELSRCTALAREHGLAALCRVLFNSNEFVTVE
jgi:hypothetical protein